MGRGVRYHRSMQPTCAFIPPYLIARLTEQAPDDHVERCGERTVRVDADLRAQRTPRPPKPVSDGDVDGTKVIHSADNTETLPGTRVRGDDEPPSGDTAVDEAYDATGQIHTLFANGFNRDAIDGAGSPVTVTVHYGENYDNAFWNGDQLVFGDGDGTVFERFTKPPDVLSHEFTHGVTQYAAGLDYQGQSGALNESVADCFAAMCKQQVLGQVAVEADWLIGVGLFKPGVNARALRSMKEPGTAYDDPRIGKDPQVGSMDQYVDTTEDNGGVHINSGIPNRAFYLTATSIGGNSWQAPGQIWYAALTGDALTPGTDFAGFAQATVDAATALFGPDSPEASAVIEAWRSVGVSGSPTRGSGSSGVVRVRRTGGIAGMTVEGELDLSANPAGDEVAQLLAHANLMDTTSTPQPDRFVYHLRVGGREVSIAEQDLSPDLARVVALVLGR